MVIFIERFSFKVGYSVAYCEENNIDPLSTSEEESHKDD